MIKKTAGVALLIFLIRELLLHPVSALPYQPTRESFLRFFNNVKWETSSKFFFKDAYECSEEMDWCRVDYEEVSAIGKRTCIGMPLQLTQYEGKTEWKLITRPYETMLGKEIYPGECGSWEQLNELDPSAKDFSEDASIAKPSAPYSLKSKPAAKTDFQPEETPGTVDATEGSETQETTTEDYSLDDQDTREGLIFIAGVSLLFFGLGYATCFCISKRGSKEE